MVSNIRTLAPAFRITTLLTGIYLIVLNQFVLLWPVIFRYNLFLDNASMKPGNVRLGVQLVKCPHPRGIQPCGRAHLVRLVRCGGALAGLC